MEMFATSGTYLWSFVTQIFHSGQPIGGCDRKTFEVMTNFPAQLLCTQIKNMV